MLIFLSYIYWIIWVIRKWLYEKGILKTRRLLSPVICVGNITTGGTGKTPTVIAIAKLLQKSTELSLKDTETALQQDASIARIKTMTVPAFSKTKTSYVSTPRISILTRGYKRMSQSPVTVVSDGSSLLSSPVDAGDEPYLIASALNGIPVIAGADRYKSGIYAHSNFNTELFILDDGYQHLKLHRDINILLIDATNPFGNGYLLPKGILREPLKAISRADCIIISKVSGGDIRAVEKQLRYYNNNSPIFYCDYKVTNIKDFDGNMPGLHSISGKNLLIFSGIGNPHYFRKVVENNKGKVIKELIYPDHHWYKDKDLKDILDEAYKLSVDAILTTEKDAIRIKGTHQKNINNFKMDILILQVEMEIDKNFQGWISRKIKH